MQNQPPIPTPQPASLQLPSLSPRQKEVLNAVVQSFISQAEPISSNFLTKSFQLGASAATIRNTMAELERLGLIEHPHTSAGRLPTEKGYRYYIDTLMKLNELRAEEKKIILSHLHQAKDENEIIKATAQMLSQVSQLLGVATSETLGQNKIERLLLVRIAEKKMMVVLHLSHDLIRTLMLELTTELSDREIDYLSQILNQRFSGKSVSNLNNDFLKSLSEEAESSNIGEIRIFTSSILKLLTQKDDFQIEVSGTKNIVHQPEFERIEDIEGIIELIDNKKTLVHFLRSRHEMDGITVTVGNENQMEIFKTHSVITSNYHLGGQKGTIGVIGPTRMNYGKLISIVDYTTKLISQLK